MIQFPLYLQKRTIVDMIVMSALTELIRVRSHPDWFCSFADAVCSKLNTAQTRAVRARPGRAAHSVVPDPFQMSLICINVAGKKLVIFCKLAILADAQQVRQRSRGVLPPGSGRELPGPGETYQPQRIVGQMRGPI
jgi:hypothetical protein